VNRADRRAAKKRTPAYLRITPEDAKKRFIQNGITEKDLAENYELGRIDGYKQGSNNAACSIYAAIALAANKLYGFGGKRCKDLIYAVDQLVQYAITTKELTDEVFERFGIDLDPDDPIERIQ
jgi:hypothetical protein